MIRRVNEMRGWALHSWALTISGVEVVDISIAKGTAGDCVAANPNA